MFGSHIGTCKPAFIIYTQPAGGVAEWLNAAVLKTVEPSRAPGVRIPPPPPVKCLVFSERSPTRSDVLQ